MFLQYTLLKLNLPPALLLFKGGALGVDAQDAGVCTGLLVELLLHVQKSDWCAGDELTTSATSVETRSARGCPGSPGGPGTCIYFSVLLLPARFSSLVQRCFPF